MTSPLLSVRDLSVLLRSGHRDQILVDRMRFDLFPGQILSIVGESGSGKSMTAKALVGLLPRGSTATGKAIFREHNLLAQGSSPPRGTGIGLIFQEPMTALTPVLTIGRQMTEAMVSHRLCGTTEAWKLAIEMLSQVGIPEAKARMRQYPHELSGGMRQRVIIAMMMLLKPDILIADEPTTALDVTVQAQILDLLKDIVRRTEIGLVLITHDMGVVAETANDVIVMKDGRAVESGSVQEIFKSPKESYTKALLQAVPRVDESGAIQDEPDDKVLLSVKGVSKTFDAQKGLLRSTPGTQALRNISFDIHHGETLALVGESGSGKSTIGRVISMLTAADSGSVDLNGLNLFSLRGKALRQARRRVQMIFQDPYASLDPRHQIGSTIAEPIQIHERISRTERRARVETLLTKVGLKLEMAARYPHEFSGGQRQRIAIARAIAAKPQLIVADEPTSALDVSIQAQILDLIGELKEEEDLTILLISHDLAVVRQIANRVAVMRHGQILEVGPTEKVWSEPLHPYTKALIEAAPVPDPDHVYREHQSVPTDYATGPLEENSPGHWVAS